MNKNKSFKLITITIITDLIARKFEIFQRLDKEADKFREGCPLGKGSQFNEGLAGLENF